MKEKKKERKKRRKEKQEQERASKGKRRGSKVREGREGRKAGFGCRPRSCLWCERGSPFSLLVSARDMRTYFSWPQILPSTRA